MGPFRRGGRLRERRGFILLTVILATLALTLLALAALALSTAEHRAAEWDRAWIGSATGGTERLLVDLGLGYRVLAVPVPGEAVGVPTLRSLGWCLDPAVEALGPWDPEAVMQVAPALGPLGPGALVVLAESLAPPPDPFAGADPDPFPEGVFLVGEGVRVLPGAPPGLLVVSEGDVRLEGSGIVPGVVIAGGRLRVGSEVRLLGGARAAGFEGAGEGAFAFDHALVEAALSAFPACPSLLYRPGRLGRF